MKSNLLAIKFTRLVLPMPGAPEIRSLLEYQNGLAAKEHKEDKREDLREVRPVMKLELIGVRRVSIKQDGTKQEI
ncbi:MAG: hypothetical protein NTW21_21550 [Verrucomicrobia bacterium]|nr:hypothetical protein [Verrucomicrobiota bacterium]